MRFDHGAVSGSCVTCHNGTSATGKSAGHISSSNTCDACHVTSSWTNVRFNHNEVAGSCSTCHNGVTAAGKPGGHFVTTEQCDTCHRTTGWGSISFSHSSAGFPTGHRARDCTDCHRTNSQNAAYSTPAYAPDCAGCHANDYRAGEHKKYGNVKYRVDELRDCAGSCHEYTDATLTTIKKRRNNEHRSGSGGF